MNGPPASADDDPAAGSGDEQDCATDWNLTKAQFKVLACVEPVAERRTLVRFWSLPKPSDRIYADHPCRIFASPELVRIKYKMIFCVMRLVFMYGLLLAVGSSHTCTLFTVDAAGNRVNNLANFDRWVCVHPSTAENSCVAASQVSQQNCFTSPGTNYLATNILWASIYYYCGALCLILFFDVVIPTFVERRTDVKDELSHRQDKFFAAQDILFRYLGLVAWSISWPFIYQAHMGSSDDYALHRCYPGQNQCATGVHEETALSLSPMVLGLFYGGLLLDGLLLVSRIDEWSSFKNGARLVRRLHRIHKLRRDAAHILSKYSNAVEGSQAKGRYGGPRQQQQQAVWVY